MSTYHNEKGGGEIAAAARASDIIAFRNSAGCINCRSSLKNESDLAQRIKVCAECLTIYALIDNAITLANENR